MTDASAEVTLLQSYDPFGNLLKQSGPGFSGFGYTGEQEVANYGLVFLRARYYDPSVGRFVSKDRWSGSMLRPQTQNGWAYVSNNPINQTDSSGLCEDQAGDWECWVVYGRLTRKFPHLSEYFEQKYGVKLDTLPKDVLERALNRPSGETIVQGSPSIVLALIRLFEADHLPGDSAQERLQWILNQQAAYGITKTYVQFGSFFPLGDSGFCKELADQRLYDQYWADIIRTKDPKTEQIGHFLTAVQLGFNPEGAYYISKLFDGLFNKIPGGIKLSAMESHTLLPIPADAEANALNLIVGHEFIGDGQGFEQMDIVPQQYFVATEEARNKFRQAVILDRLGNDQLRDIILRDMLIETDARFRDQDAVPERIGNSMQDFRNSVKGWRFGQEIRNGTITSNIDAAMWLRREIYDASRTRRRLE